MTLFNIQQWIQHPESLNRDTLYELRNLLARYPYFQTARLLYLKNLYILHDVSLGEELKKSVLYVADRRKLFQLIEVGTTVTSWDNEEKAATSLSLSTSAEPSLDRTLTLIDAFLATVPEEVTSHTDFDYSIDYTSYLLQTPEETSATSAEEAASPKMKGQDLIDGFIEKSEQGLKSQGSLLPDSMESDVDMLTESTFSDEQRALSEEDDSCFTETLAKIYIKQHRYSKALEIIKKLSLKYPKKNAYFADQIRFLEKLIINANSK